MAASSSSYSVLSEKSDAEIEEMLDRMLTRLALCDDSKLVNLLSKLLPLSISSLSSPSSAVRNKVLEILSHVNKRVKHQQQIGLPLEELWKLYMEANAAPMVRNFCIVYIEMAFERVPKEEKENMAPNSMSNISKLPPQHQDIILRITVKVIGECHSTQIDDEVAAKYRSMSGCEDKEIFFEFCLHTVLYQPPSQGGGCPPGLSIFQSARVTGKQPLKSDMLLLRKLGVLNVIEVMELAPELVYPLYLAACADSHDAVVKRGEELLKKSSGVNLDDANLINRLFLLFNGTAGAEHITQNSRVSPGNPAFRVRLMSIFCRSITAANSFPSTLQCIFGCIYGAILLKKRRPVCSCNTVFLQPSIFIRFEDDKNVSSLYEELWEQNMSSERATLHLYIGEIVTLISEGIVSSSWTSKRKGAKATSKLCEVLGESLSSHHHLLLTSLMNELPGRIWEGKEDLLEALSSLCTSCHKAISVADPASENAILSVVTSVCRKKVKKYRQAGFFCLEQVLKAFNNPDFFNMVFPLLIEMCNLASITKSSQVLSANDVDKAESHQTDDTSVPHDKIMDCITSCIHLARLSDILEHQKNLVHVFFISLSPGISWTVKVSVFTSIKELCSRLHDILNDLEETSLHVNISALVNELFHSVSPKVVECICTVKIAQVHVAASECLLELTKLYGVLPPVNLAEVKFKCELLQQWEMERNEQAKSLMKNCIDILESLEQRKGV